MKTKSLLFLFVFTLFGLLISGCGASSAAPEELPSLELNQQIIEEDIGEYEVTSVMMFDSMSSETYNYEAKEGMKRLVFSVNVKNLSSKEVASQDFIKITVKYQDDFEYRIAEYFEIGEASFYTSSIPLIPLKNTTILCVVEIPDDVALAKDSLQTVITFDKEAYHYTGTIEVAYKYINSMVEINSTLETVTRDLNSIATDMNFTVSPQKSDLIGFAQRFGELKQILDSLVNQLETMTDIPTSYKEGHENYLQGVKILSESLAYASDESIISDDFSLYSNNVYTAGEMAVSAGAYIETAEEQLPFLSR